MGGRGEGSGAAAGEAAEGAAGEGGWVSAAAAGRAE